MNEKIRNLKLDTQATETRQPKDKEVDTSKTEHEGYLEKISFTGKGDWIVCKIEGWTCTGKISQREMGARYKLTGKAVYSAKYTSWQFQFDKYEKLADASRRGTINFLTNQITGIGPKQAELIWNAFGEQSIDTIADHPDKIAGRLGILPDKAQNYAEQIKTVRKQAALSTKLYSIGLTQWFVEKLIGQFGEKAEEELKHRCFELTKIHGIGFLKAADVADKIGMPKDHPTRVKAGIAYAVTTAQQLAGHCCVPEDDLLRDAQELLKIDVAKIKKYMDEMVAEFKLVTEKTDLNDLVKHLEKRRQEREREKKKEEDDKDSMSVDDINNMLTLDEDDFAKLS